MGTNEDLTKTTALAGDGYSSSSLSDVNMLSWQLQQMKKSWEGSLEQRAAHKSQDELSSWFMKVLEMSDSYASLWKFANSG
jgi:hypothetical protein